MRASTARGRDDMPSPQLQRTAISGYARRQVIDVVEWVRAAERVGEYLESLLSPRPPACCCDRDGHCSEARDDVRNGSALPRGSVRHGPRPGARRRRLTCGQSPAARVAWLAVGEGATSPGRQ